MQETGSTTIKIIHIENDPSDAELVRTTLEDAGLTCHLTVVKSRREFADAARTNKFDLILSDFSLPSFDGAEAFRITRNVSPETPFIFVSGTAGEDAAIQCLLDGAADYVLKSKLTRLVPAVGRALREADEKRKLGLAEKLRETALEDLRNSEARFRGVLECAPDAAIMVDSGGKIAFANQRAEALFGYGKDELIGKPLHVLLPERYRRIHEKHVSEFNSLPHARELGAGVDLYGRRSDGTEFPADIMLSPLNMDEGMWVLAMIRDVTVAKKAEESLRRSEERYKRLVDSARDAIYTMSAEGVLLTLNPAFETLTGWGIEEWIGKSFTGLIHPDDRENAVNSVRATLDKGEEKVTQYRVLKKSGGYAVGEFSTTRFRLEDGTVGLLGIARDVTAQIAMEEQLRQAQKMESVGTLAGGIAHDFNNILGIILGYATLTIRSVKEDKALTRNLQSIESAAQRGVGLVRQLLMFARKQERSLQMVVINDLVADLQEMISETFPRVISVRLKLAKEDLLVYGDQTEIHQAVLNLCVNARDAMMDRPDGSLSGGTLTISTALEKGSDVRRRHSSALDEDYVSISVSDTGVGMDESTQARIFEPFFTTKERGKGTGLGLSTVYGIVSAQNGIIEVESEYGSGTSFKIFLPARKSADVASDTFQAQPPDSLDGKETVLVVEDEAGLRDLLYDILAGRGYKVLTAEDGQRALATFLDNKGIDLVVSDIGLPKVGGLDLFQAVKKINPDVKVILVSGFVDEAEKQNMIRKGVNKFIQKPYHPVEVLSRIREVLNNG